MSSTAVPSASNARILLNARLREIESEIKVIRAALASPHFGDVLEIGHALRNVDRAHDSAVNAWSVIAADRNASWRQIGDCLGMSRQGAQQRFANYLVDRELALG